MSRSYESGIRGFYYAMASDAITNYLEDKPRTRIYLQGLEGDLARATEAETPEDAEDLLGLIEEATGAANTLASQVKRNNEAFCGDYYKILIAAAYDLLGVEY